MNLVITYESYSDSIVSTRYEPVIGERMMVKHNSHRKPTDVLGMSYGARENCGGILVKMQHKQHFFI